MKHCLQESLRFYEQRDSLGLSPEQRYMVERTFGDFQRAGAALDDASKERMNELNQELSKLTVAFGQNLLAENNAYELVLETEEQLAGLPDFARSAGRASGQGSRP